MNGKSNWLDLHLSKDKEEQVQKSAQLYRAQYIDTIDSAFEIATGIEILRTHNYGTGEQGGFARALVQYGFTNRDGGPMDKGIRSNFKDLLDNEAKVRAWWKTVDEPKKRDWHSARAIFKHWQASLKPKKPKKTLPNRRMPVEPMVEPWAQHGRPSAEAMQAKERADAEAEAARLAAEASRAVEAANVAALQAELRKAQNRIANLEEAAREAAAAPLAWADVIQHAKTQLNAMPADQRHQAINQWTAAVVETIKFAGGVVPYVRFVEPEDQSADPEPAAEPEQPKPAAKKPRRGKRKAGAVAESPKLLAWTADGTAPAGGDEEYYLRRVGNGGMYEVYLAPVGTPDRKMGDYRIGAAAPKERAEAIAEQHFAKRSLGQS